MEKVDAPQFNNIHLAILTYTSNGQLCTQYVKSLLDTLRVANERGLTITPIFSHNDNIIARAKNNMLAKALAMESPTKCTHVMFIDGDIGWGVESVMKFLQSDKDIIGGIHPSNGYNFAVLDGDGPRLFHETRLQDNSSTTLVQWKQCFARNENVPIELFTMAFLLKYNMMPWPSGEIEIENGMASIRYISSGFLLLKRRAIEQKIKPLIPDLKYVDTTGFLTTEKEQENAYAYFQSTVRQEKFLSEDWNFCDLCRNAGLNIVADIDVTLSRADTHTFVGNFGAWVLSRAHFNK